MQKNSTIDCKDTRYQIPFEMLKFEKCIKNHRKPLFFPKSAIPCRFERDLGGVQYHVVMQKVSGIWSFCNQGKGYWL